MKFNWTLRKPAAPINYAATVDAYKAEYARRYAEYIHTGKTFE